MKLPGLYSPNVFMQGPVELRKRVKTVRDDLDREDDVSEITPFNEQRRRKVEKHKNLDQPAELDSRMKSCLLCPIWYQFGKLEYLIND